VVGGWDFAENDAIPTTMRPPAFTARTWPASSARTAPRIRASHRASIWFRCACSTTTAAGSSLGSSRLAVVVQHRNDYAHPITTVNLSIGMNWNSDSVPSWANLEDELSALKSAGLVITVSAGNSFAQYNAPGVSYPAAVPT